MIQATSGVLILLKRTIAPSLLPIMSLHGQPNRSRRRIRRLSQSILFLAWCLAVQLYPLNAFIFDQRQTSHAALRTTGTFKIADRLTHFSVSSTNSGPAPTQRDENSRPNNLRYNQKKKFLRPGQQRRRQPPRMNKPPEQVESELLRALLAGPQTPNTRFPTVRECNAALAAFGDAGELLRALRLFGKMRKAAAAHPTTAPTPTLVTYSTLMSRAVKLHKPRVALRLWDLMMKQSPSSSSTTNYYSNSSISVDSIDIKAANIRMNCFAKLANVTAAQDLLHQMKTGCGPDVPRLEPNLVTYNTLLHACHQARDLDAALAAAQLIHRPDARTYTSLIATVARQPSDAAGRNDPTLAFTLLNEMNQRGVRPNGMTYSALIDACGRCGRSDLALQGLRIMLRQKAAEQKVAVAGQTYTLANEVGAWTAAINACGKAGRLNTAVRLFHAMEGFGVQANAITCGSLTDSLLRAGRTAETLEVLRYMKVHGIVPSEVMYTSLMMRAEGLLQTEEQEEETANMMWLNAMDDTSDSKDAKAVDIYTELMKSLTANVPRQREHGGPHSNLIKVFLVFQQMKAAGAEPDVACYNALLKACATAGDWEHAQDVLRQMVAADLEPNDTSWRHFLQTAVNMKRSDLAEEAWKQGLRYQRHGRHVRDEPLHLQRWNPSVTSFGALVSAFVGEAQRTNDIDRKLRLYRRIVDLYDSLLLGDDKDDMGLDRIDVDALLDNSRAMLWILRGVVSLREWNGDTELDKMINSILQLKCLHGLSDTRLSWTVADTLQRAGKIVDK